MKSIQGNSASKFMIVCGWIFFFVIHSYYSSVMLAFFLVDPKIPFESLDEAVQNFPEWSLYLQSDHLILKEIMSGFDRPEYQQYVKTLTRESSKYIYKSWFDGIKLLEKPKSISIVETAGLLSFNAENPGKLHNFAKFGCDSLKPLQSGLIFPKGSPLNKIFHRISLKTLQNGQLNLITTQHFGPKLSKQESELAAVTMGQIFTLFCYIGLIIVVAGFFFGFEMIHKTFDHEKKPCEHHSKITRKLIKSYCDN